MLQELRALRAENAQLRQELTTRLAAIERNTLDTSRGVHGANAAPILVEIAA